jgi:hypothetical protein
MIASYRIRGRYTACRQGTVEAWNRSRRFLEDSDELGCRARNREEVYRRVYQTLRQQRYGARDPQRARQTEASVPGVPRVRRSEAGAIGWAVSATTVSVTEEPPISRGACRLPADSARPRGHRRGGGRNRMDSRGICA